jgi:hypothetical protein
VKPLAPPNTVAAIAAPESTTLGESALPLFIDEFLCATYSSGTPAESLNIAGKFLGPVPAGVYPQYGKANDGLPEDARTILSK